MPGTFSKCVNIPMKNTVIIVLACAKSEKVLQKNTTKKYPLNICNLKYY